MKRYILLACMVSVWTALAIGVYPVKASAPCEAEYKVSRGDTLSVIAQTCSISLKALLISNPQIKNRNLIYVNQVLVIPEPEKVLIDFSQPASKSLNSTDILSVLPGLPPFDYLEGDAAWIDVDLSEQRVYAYKGSKVVEEFIVSTGTNAHPTVTGQYRIWVKFEQADMRGPGYHLKKVPSVMYFYKGYGLHGTYWHNNFGTPMSHGCINLSIEDAAWLYDFASVGTLVNVHP